MKKVLIIGAHGKIAQIVRRRLLAETDAYITLFLRNGNRMKVVDDTREKIITGDANSYADVLAATKDQDIVYVNLGGQLAPMVTNIVKAMEVNQVARIIYISSLGIYHEVPEPFGSFVVNSVGKKVMNDTIQAAQVIENSTLNYTIIRSAYMNDDENIDYELTQKGQPFQGTIISRNSIADLVVKTIKDPNINQKSSLGIAKPGTDGDIPMY